jgi:23S rRNA pseudouridine2605 synthase
MEQRLQKLLAAAGIGSRRYCEGLIVAGRITVNGNQVTELGAQADAEKDDIRLDGKPIAAKQEHVYLALNKPLGYVTTVKDPHAKHTVMDFVKGVAERIYPVGRLDADSAGLLILSNDGEFTHRLTHPSHQMPKTYRAVVRGEVPEWAGADLRKGVLLDDGMTAPAAVEWVDYDQQNNATIIDITIHEGRNRQVRRMFDTIGYPVLALTRMQIGPVKLKGLAPGTWRRLHPSEVKALLEEADPRPAELPQVPIEREPSPRIDERREREADRRRIVATNRERSSSPAVLEAAHILTQKLRNDEDAHHSENPRSPRTRHDNRPKNKPKRPAKQ